MDANNLTCHGGTMALKGNKVHASCAHLFFLTCRKRHSKVIRNIMYFYAPFSF